MKSTIKRSLISELRGTLGQTVKVCGLVEKVRDQKKMQFVVLQDRSGSVQLINEKGLRSDLEKTISSLTTGSAVSVIGKSLANEQVKLGAIEIVIEDLTVDSLAQPELPITDSSGLDAQLNWRFLSLRKPASLLIFEIETAVQKAMREYWYERSFIEIHSPKLMHSASESGAETFSLEYFDLGKAYLAQSPQFYKQMAMAAGFERVFEIGPVFRAEPSFTAKHATEFTSVDMEMSWINSHEDIMQFEEEWLAFVLTEIERQFGSRIKDVFGVEVKIPSLPFPRITMESAYQLLAQLGHTIPPATKRGDIDPEGERKLAKLCAEEYGAEFYFLTDYPTSLRPFYHMRNEANPALTKSFDLMWKGVEITTGAQREHRYDILAKQAEEVGLRSSVEYYLDFFKYGCPPHGGFGTGLSRIVMLLLNAQSIREVTFLHRGPQRLTP